ncbi:MAG: enoyl-CoA hydratase/isomerase family protein [Fidelibacterota bacterium]
MAGPILQKVLNEGQVIRLILNRPKGNILDGPMMEELQRALNGLRDQPDIKLVQLTGAGDHFCFGASVPEHRREQAGAMLKQFHGLFLTLMDLAIPSAALVSGNCLGGGLELALMCNFLFADGTARLGQPEMNLGLFPPQASLILPLKIGQSRADEVILTGKTFSAQEMASMRLITRLFEDRKALESGVEKWVREHILPKSASSLRYGVQAARWEFNRVLRNQLESVEKFYLEELMSTHDAGEGIDAFVQKRPPRWKNR